MSILSKRIGALLLFLLIIAALSLAVDYPPPVQGHTLLQPTSIADFARIDAYLENQMAELRIPGLALGIVQGNGPPRGPPAVVGAAAAVACAAAYLSAGGAAHQPAGFRIYSAN